MIPPALLNAILDRPADDTPRLVAADWLDEHAGPGDECPECRGYGYEHGKRFAYVVAGNACGKCGGSGRIPDTFTQRAELIRVQCELARTWLSGRANDPCPACGVLSGEVHLDSCRVIALRRRECELLDAAVVGDWAAFPGFVREWWWRRGFVGRLSLDLAAWQRHAPALLAAHPLERAEVADVPGLVFYLGSPGTAQNETINHLWRLIGCLRYGDPIANGEVLMNFSERHFLTRADLVEYASETITSLVARLRTAAGDRWPLRPNILHIDIGTVANLIWEPIGGPARKGRQ